MSDQFEDMRALERAIHSAGSATGIWTLRDPSGRWRRMLYYVHSVTLGTSWEGVYDLWALEVRSKREELLGIPWTQDFDQEHVRFLGMVPGDVDNAASLTWADSNPWEYPKEVPLDLALYTVVFDVQGERRMSKRMSRDWLEAELYVVKHYMDQGAVLGEDMLVGATIKGYEGCFEPASMIYTTYDGQSPS